MIEKIKCVTINCLDNKEFYWSIDIVIELNGREFNQHINMPMSKKMKIEFNDAVVDYVIFNNKPIEPEPQNITNESTNKD